MVYPASTTFLPQRRSSAKSPSPNGNSSQTERRRQELTLSKAATRRLWAGGSERYCAVSRISCSRLSVFATARLPTSALVMMPASGLGDRKSTRLNSSHTVISYAVFCLKKKKKTHTHSNHKKKEQKKTQQH